MGRGERRESRKRRAIRRRRNHAKPRDRSVPSAVRLLLIQRRKDKSQWLWGDRHAADYRPRQSLARRAEAAAVYHVVQPRLGLISRTCANGAQALSASSAPRTRMGVGGVL